MPLNYKQQKVVLTIENDQVINIQHVRENEFIASVECFVQILKEAGFIVSQPYPTFNQNKI